MWHSPRPEKAWAKLAVLKQPPLWKKYCCKVRDGLPPSASLVVTVPACKQLWHGWTFVVRKQKQGFRIVVRPIVIFRVTAGCALERGRPSVTLRTGLCCTLRSYCSLQNNGDDAWCAFGEKSERGREKGDRGNRLFPSSQRVLVYETAQRQEERGTSPAGVLQDMHWCWQQHTSYNHRQ